MALKLPNLAAALVDSAGLVKGEAWISFFSQFVQAPAPIMSIIVGINPFSYTVKEPGMIAVSGGTVSAIALIRGVTTPISIDVTGVKLIPVCIKDIIKVTYTGLPTMKFIPGFV